MTLTFVTGNELKFTIASKIFQKYQIDLIQENIETPEIQSTEVSEISDYSAKFACEKLNKPVVVTDAGWYITCLNGFPGPFVKYINDWLEPKQILNLANDFSNREVIIQECVS